MFESGNRVQDTLADLADIMAGRDAAICRELTKLHEEILRAPVAELAKAAGTLETRGEFVLVIGPSADAQVMTDDRLDDLLRAALQTAQRQGCGSACGRAVRPAAPRDLCPRARTRQGERGGRRWRRLTPRRPASPQKSPRPSASPRSAPACPPKAAPPPGLMAKGYRILAKRFRTPHGEIDLVARKRNLVAFVEVKARATLDEAAYAVTPRQQARIIAAAEAWLMAHPEHGEYRTAFRRHADCAEAPAPPSVSGIRRQHLTPPCPATSGPAK